MTSGTCSRSRIKGYPAAMTISLLQRLAKKTILSFFEAMPNGRLEVAMPNGVTSVLGDGSGGISAKILIRDDQFFIRCLFHGDIGLAESYIDGLCDFSSIEEVISWFLLNHNQSPVLNESKAAGTILNLLGFVNRIRHRFRANSLRLSRKNISEHYDLGNEFFKTFLDSTMTYSCAYFQTPIMSLEEAQLAKCERIAQQLRLKEHDRVLEVGCGWGAFSCYIAKRFGVSVTALTISEEQYSYTKHLVAKQELSHLVDVRFEDYRTHSGSYDKIVSIEMIEAVGDEYMDTFIQCLDRLLARDGLLVMQMITSANSRYDVLKNNADFIQKHIFPGSLLPSLHRVSSAMLKCGDLQIVDLFDLTPSYPTTLARWEEAFQDKLDQIRALGFDERFIRKWKYYFGYCQAAFAMRNISVVQATYSRPNNLLLNGGAKLL